MWVKITAPETDLVANPMTVSAIVDKTVSCDLKAEPDMFEIVGGTPEDLEKLRERYNGELQVEEVIK